MDTALTQFSARLSRRWLLVAAGAAIVAALGVGAFLLAASTSPTADDSGRVAQRHPLPYDSAWDGSEDSFAFGDLTVSLLGGGDGAGGAADYIDPRPGMRIVSVVFILERQTSSRAVLGEQRSQGATAEFGPNAVRLVTDAGEQEALLLRVDNMLAPVDLQPGVRRFADAAFEVPEEVMVREIVVETTGPDGGTGAWVLTRDEER
jgi:hypothetical protein